jgi:hypothetical protein
VRRLFAIRLKFVLGRRDKNKTVRRHGFPFDFGDFVFLPAVGGPLP